MARRKKGDEIPVKVADLIPHPGEYDPEKHDSVEAFSGFLDEHLDWADAWGDASVIFVHEGPGKAREWSLKRTSEQMEELKRKARLKAEIGPDATADQMIDRPDFLTPKGREALLRLSWEVVTDCLLRLEGFEDPAIDNLTGKSEMGQALADLGLCELLFFKATEAQEVLTRQRFRASRPSGKRTPSSTD